ncbi:single-stranded DNA-binding protein [Staphylococcus capitis]|uniref:single-stranded DNA-binding protein n=1 Tax=Staphylococcus capitis TaxID=29388 RepID=UPI00145B1303|nr:single-stranded DNA-binding protein [Staphylococcus capitis]NMK92047.1 single-stranded DNA-binding protein [Staphylococcus capitis]
MINTASLSGRLTKDPEYRTTQNGVAVTTFSLAVQRSFKDANGDYQADFPNVVAFRNTAEVVKNYTHKGALVNVTGRLQTRNYENQNGQRVFVTEVVAEQVQLINTNNGQQSQQKGSYQQNANNVPQQQNGHKQTQQQGQAQNGWQQQRQNNNQQQNNPFGNANGPIDIQDDDLPF